MAYKPFGERLAPATLATAATLRGRNPATVANVASVATPDLASDTFEERAAIAEFDGGLSHEHAETRAALCAMPTPNDVSADQLNNVIDAAARFLDRRSNGRTAPRPR